MLVALRDQSIGDAVLKLGDEVPLEVQRALPPGRLETLKNTRFVEEQTDHAALSLLTKRVEALEQAGPQAKRKRATARRRPRAKVAV